jgi:hypothetical protein
MPRIWSARKRRTYRFAIGVVAVVLVTTAAVGQLERVHHDYHVWALWPGPSTPTLPFRGRTYLRGDNVTTVPGNSVRLGAAPSDGEVYSAPPVPGADPAVLFVRYPDGTVTAYALSGGS